MQNFEINTKEDLFLMLDQFTSGVNWNEFYTERTKPAPFLANNKIPDKCVVDFVKNYKSKTAIEFGCGEGRNAIYLAKNGLSVDAYDLSEVAIQNAQQTAKQSKVESVSFEACNIFKKNFNKTYDLAIDSGLFHHLSPHRRLQYREILTSVIQKDGYFILLCFASGEDAADEVNDYEFYHARRVGVAFTEERLRSFFDNDFVFLQIERGTQICTPEMLENPYLYKCLLKKR